MSKNDGGPAFPQDTTVPSGKGGVIRLEPADRTQRGMTLRDWFAGQALAGVIQAVSNSNQERPLEDVAKISYIVADDMLAAREET